MACRAMSWLERPCQYVRLRNGAGCSRKVSGRAGFRLGQGLGQGHETGIRNPEGSEDKGPEDKGDGGRNRWHTAICDLSVCVPDL